MVIYAGNIKIFNLYGVIKMLDYVIDATIKYVEQMPKECRKKFGQFFTSKETAIFMAELFDIPKNKDSISILDPGAGSGILAVALIERLQKYSAIKNIELTCYENDSNIQDLLKKNLHWVSEHTSVKISYKVIKGNYILDLREIIQKINLIWLLVIRRI